MQPSRDIIQKNFVREVNPDTIVLASQYYARFFSEKQKKYYPEMGVFFRRLIEESETFGYEVVKKFVLKDELKQFVIPLVSGDHNDVANEIIILRKKQIFTSK